MSRFQNFLREHAPRPARAFGDRLPRRLLFQYSLLLKNLLKALDDRHWPLAIVRDVSDDLLLSRYSKETGVNVQYAKT